ncbi:MAG: hypothetical protein QXW02_02540 [Nitrososphaerota archaeon]
MRLSAITITLCLLIVVSSLSALQLMITSSSAQPTWSFSITLFPAELYMGEWGRLKANITNTDCSARLPKPYEAKFDNIPERALKSILARAREMNESGWITDYDLRIEGAHGFGGQVYFDAKLRIIGACSGKSIKLYYAQLWFPWKKYPGRDWAFRADANVELKAFNPIDYILKGFSPGSSIVLEFELFIPPDIYPEERFLKPFMDLRVHYPGWIDYTLEAYPTRGPFEIQPYRSFNLTVTDYDGMNPIAGARVVIRRLIHYYDVREYVTPENGTIRIHRLKEDDYEVRVYWNSSIFLQESPLVYMEHHTAYDLASEGIRTLLFNVEVRALDLKERALNGARIALDGVEVIAENGYALYQLVPNGNHSLQAYWMGVKLLDEWVWIGYHPTISPEIKEPKLVLKLPVDDLLVQAVDSGGMPLAANFTVSDPRGALPDLLLYSSSGLLNITQLVMGDYWVRALNCSQAFRKCAEASGIFQPGQLMKLQLPLHSITLHLYSRSGMELGNASVILGSVEARADQWGYASFPGIPKGKYDVRILWNNVEVYDGQIMVSESGSWDIIADVYDVGLELKTADGRPFSAYWILVDPSGHRHEMRRPSSIISARLIPRGPCNLTVIDERNLTLISSVMSVEELASMRELKLPIGDMVIRVLWSDGAPIANARIVLVGPASLRSEGLTDAQGMISLGLAPFANYSLRVYYPRTSLVLFAGNVTFVGDVVEVRAGRTGIMVKVVDALGNPLPGAAVRLHVSGIILGEGKSGSDGVVAFSGIPHLGAYQLEVKHGPLIVNRIIRPGESAVIELEAINLLGLTMYIQDLMALLPAIAVVIAITIIIIVLRRRFRASARAEIR